MMKSRLLLALMMFMMSFMPISLALGESASGCFRDQGISSAVASSVLFLDIPAPGPGDQRIDGTGFIGPDHLIYTAGHLFAPGFRKSGNPVSVFDSTGAHIGYATLVSGGEPDAVASRDALGFMRHDVAVLRMMSADEARGVVSEDDMVEMSDDPVANVAGRPMLEFSSRYSALATTLGDLPFMGGGSGAPAIDVDGQVVGIVSASSVSLQGTVSHIHGDALPGLHLPSSRYGRAPDDISTTAIAGGHIFLADAGRITTANASGDVTIPAYPMKHCMVYRARLTDKAVSVTRFSDNPA